MKRDFLQQFSVNWNFLPPEVFHSSLLSRALLILHVILLLVFTWRWWSVLPRASPRRMLFSSEVSLTSSEIVVFLFIGNFIGIACARSLHYQFYVWYFYSLHVLLWATRLPVSVRLGLLAVVEYLWNSYPPAPVTSAMLQGCHVLILGALLSVNPSSLC